MHYQLRAIVQGQSLTVHPINIETPEYKITFESEIKKVEGTEDKIQFTNFLSITAKIENYEDYIPKLVANAHGKGHHALTANQTHPVRGKMIEMLHYIESMGTFWLGIKKIDMNSLEEKWLPDSEEERKASHLQSFTMRQHYESRPEQIDPATLVKIIAKKKDFDYLTIPLAFYRVGKLEFENFNYYLAFFSYYLFLDSLFGQGKFKSDQVMDAFKQSGLLKTAIEQSIGFLNQEKNKQKKEQIEKFFAKKNKQLDSVNGIIDFLVETRGELFHFSLHDSRQKIHPLNEDTFQPIAFLILMISVQVVVQVANDSTFRNHFVPTKEKPSQ